MSIGLPTRGTSCAYSSDLDREPCGQASVTHITSYSPEWGFVDLFTCETHEYFAVSAGKVMFIHPTLICTEDCQP